VAWKREWSPFKEKDDEGNGREWHEMGEGGPTRAPDSWDMGNWGHYDRIEFNYDRVYMNLTALNIWEGFF